MRIVVFESKVIQNLIESIVENHQEEMADVPLSEFGDQLITCRNRLVRASVVESVFTKVMVMGYGGDSKHEIANKEDVKPAYFAILKKDSSLDWLKNVDWYEISYSFSDESVTVMVNT